MNKPIRLRKKFYWVILSLFALAFLLLCSLFPALGDDFNRLSTLSHPLSIRWSLFLKTYTTLNGRLLGNFLSFFFMVKPLQILAKMITFSTLIYFIFLLFRQKATVFLTLAFLLFLDLPIFREVVAWNAGFFNYGPCMALIVFLITRYARPKDDPSSKAEPMIIFLCAFSACLFTENISLYVAIMPILALLFFRRTWRFYLPGLLGGFLGNLVLFSSPVYHTIIEGTDSYRSLPHQGILRIVESNASSFAELFLSPGLLCLFAFLLFAHFRHSRRPCILLSLMLLIFLGLANSLNLPSLYILFGQALFFLTLLPVFIPLTHGRLALFALFSLGAGMLPLLFVQPIGARNFFFSRVMEWILLLALYHSLPPISTRKRHLLMAGLLLLMGIQMGILLFFYQQNRRIYDLNIQRLTQATLQEEKSVSLLPFPNPSFYIKPGWEKAANYLSSSYHKPPVDIQK